LAGLGLLVGLAALSTAQPPAPAGKQTPPPAKAGSFDEVEDAPDAQKAKKKITVEDEGPPPVTVPKGAFYVRIEDLFRAANEARHPAVKDVLGRYAVAFDRLTDSDDRITRICPIPIRWPEEKFPERFGVFDLTADNAPRLLRGVDLVKTKKIDHFEDLVAADVELLTDLTPGLRENPFVQADPADRLAAAERLLAAALWFHDGARDQNKRRGKGWEPTRVKLADRLADARVRRLKLAAERKDWAIVRTLGGRMVALYPTNQKLLQEVYSARLAEAEATVVASDQPSDLERARDVLAEFDSKFPGADNAAARKVQAALRQKADRLFARAEAAVKADSPDARAIVRTIELIAPDYPGLRDLQGRMKAGYTVLYVGVHQLPERMSPATARFDSEKMAVELMFEGLLEALPDETHGVRYRPALASAMPAPGALVRDVPLTRPVEWTGAAKQLFDATDVAGTLKLLRQARHTWAADGIDWLDDQTRVEALDKVRLAFQTGHPYPLSILSFKLLPARYLASKNKGPDDTEFALRPCGTGPFKLESTPGADDKKAREVVFVSNPHYSRRPGRLGQPYVKEVRFVELSRFPTPDDKISQIKGEKLHILTDVPTSELPKYQSPAAGLQGRAVVATAAANRRVQVLAVNHRKPMLQSPALRRGIAHAIDRETILNEVYRANFPDFHKPLAGPFPPKTWATPKPGGGDPRPLFDQNLAQGKFDEHFKKFGAVNLILYYPAEDPRARQACERIKKQVEAVAVGADGKVALNLEPLPTAELYRRVYDEGAFDLAYVPFDFPHDLYPLGLGSLLDPSAAARGGRNYMGVLVKQNNPSAEDETLGRLLAEARAHADPAKLAQKSHEVFTRFNEAMPFVPLWQLDRHMVVATTVKLAFDDGPSQAQPRWLPPTRLFAGVSRWRIE
jgi:ABC-type transport system substrate-binding protein